jgi:hypothetical protein
MYQEDNDSGYGTAATLAGLAALASPMGRQVRQAGKNLYQHFGSPFGSELGAIGNELGKIGGVLRKDINKGTFGASEKALNAYRESLLQRMYRPGSRDIETNASLLSPRADGTKFTWAGTKQNWGDTVDKTGASIAALLEFLKATPEASKSLFKAMRGTKK